MMCADCQSERKVGEMDKNRLLKFKKPNKEIEIIKREIRELECKPSEYVADTVRDYTYGYGIISVFYRIIKSIICNSNITERRRHLGKHLCCRKVEVTPV